MGRSVGGCGRASEFGGMSKVGRDQIRNWDLGGRLWGHCCLAQGGVSVKGKKNQESRLQREGFSLFRGELLRV